MSKGISFLFLLFIAFFTKAQTPFPCNGDFLFTRQVGTSTNTFLSRVAFIPNDINITNPGTIGPTGVNTNASVEYNGFVWTQEWNATSFTLLRVDATFTATPFIVAGMPVVNFNNAGVDKNGIMYILTNGASPNSLYAINLSTGTPTLVTGFPKVISGLTAGETAIWGDISVDPVTNRVYCWYHPNPAPTSNLRGLYEITNISGTTPAVTKIGTTSEDDIMGSLFFNDRGQLFGYGSPTVTTGSVQDRFFAIDKATGLATQYGLPDLAVTQSDGCGCAFRISLDRQVSVPFKNIPKCGKDTFFYTFTPRNYSNGGATNITFSDTLDTRLSYTFVPATLQTDLRVLYGMAVVVNLTSTIGGVNNILNITGMNIPVGQNSFTLPVLIDGSRFNGSFTVNEQAYLRNISAALGGPNEPSNDPTTFNSKDATPITINLTSSLCLPPVANNFLNTPMPQGNGATAIPGLVAADPDGNITNYTLITLPLLTEGVLSIPCPPTPMGASCSGGFANLTAAVLSANPGGINLTPAQVAAMRFDPAPNFTGTARFTFNATDNSANISNTATYLLPVTAQPPVSNNIMENSMLNTNGPTAIVPLNSADVDGTITSYSIKTLPNVASGILSIPCPPTPMGASCSGGFANLTAAVLLANPAGIVLTPAQIAALRFDPTAGFTGNATFNYDAIDNSGNVSNTANYTIPIVATATFLRPPLANNISAQPINNSNGPVGIPTLLASDLDGTIANYTITSVPPLSQGLLSVACPPTPAGASCSAGFANLTAAVLMANGGNIVLTPAQISTLRFDPDPAFVGNATFNYFATDNSNTQSNPATYTIPVVNNPPTSVNINTIAPFNGAAAPIIPLSGNDLDGTVTTFTLTTVPTLAQGILSIPCPATPPSASCSGGFANLTPTVLAANPSGIALTPAQAAGIRFAPATGFSGNLAFNYSTTDNNNLVSTLATYNITIANQPPVSQDVIIPVMPNTNGVTAISPLNSTDPDGTIANYTIYSLPVNTSGVLSIPCPPTPAMATCTAGFANITAAVLAANPNGINLTPTQMAGMRFDPAINFTGVVNFTYTATDNNGNLSNVAIYNIPISGVGNLPPVASNNQAPSMPATNAATAIPSLLGTDPDGTLTSYTLVSVPNTNEGILSVSCPPTPTGATCTGGFANLTPTVLATNGGNITLTPAQISTLRFDPNPNFVGTAVFNYFNTDNSGAQSNLASYTIVVTGTPPFSNPIIAATMPQTNGPTAIPALISNDADGTIISYQIDAVPPASQGILSIPCPPTPNGATCASGFANLTEAVLLANPGGITLTPTQMAAMRFDPAASYQGNVIFNYHATDNSGAISNTAAYTIPVSGVPPLSNDVVTPKMNNANGPTPIPSLNSTDADGTVASFTLISLPPANQGVLSIPCPPTPTGATCTSGFADLTAAVLALNPGGIALTPTQMAGMRFDPDATFIGNAAFNYAAYDNNGNISNIAAYNIPVGTLHSLPVTLVSFNANRVNNNIAVNWRAENEVNINSYEVEYSLNGTNYFNGGVVNAQNLARVNYQFILTNYNESKYFIRLKIVSNNGSISYSQIVVILNNGLVNTKLIVYPIPANNFVNIQLPSNALGSYTLNLLDVTGRLLQTKLYSNVSGGQLLNINRRTLASGIYFLKVINTDSKLQTVTKIIFE